MQHKVMLAATEVASRPTYVYTTIQHYQQGVLQHFAQLGKQRTCSQQATQQQGG